MSLREYYKDLLRCNRCGFCQANCRVYKLAWEEDYSARGRLALIRLIVEKKIPYTKNYAEVLDACLQCKECSLSCPSGLNPAEIILAAREDLVRVRGLPLAKRVIYRNVLPSNAILNLSFRSFRMVRGMVLRRFAAVHFRGLDLNKVRLGEYRFNGHHLAGIIRGSRARVAFFPGCNTTYFYPKTADAVVKVLNLNGYEVMVPNGLRCCGMPMIIAGDVATARKSALVNLAILSPLDVEAIIVACPSCGLALGQEYYRLFAASDKSSEFERLAGKVKEISAFLADMVELNPSMGTVEWRVTYHDPCHLARGLGIRQQPRDLLKRIPGLEYVELPEADSCCGGAGLFQMSHPELAGPISRRKIANITKTGAALVTSTCPVCVQRIQNFAGGKIEAMHVVQVLAQAYFAAGSAG